MRCTPPTHHPKQDDVEVKLLPGDELRLKHKSAGAKGSWEGTGHVVGGEGSVVGRVGLGWRGVDGCWAAVKER